VQQQVRPYALAWQQANRRALTRPGPLWVCLGDSLTQGIGASAFDRGWVGQVADRFSAAGQSLRVVNLSVSGARVQDVLQVQLPALRRLCEETGQPAVLSLLIGSNDLFRRRHRAGLTAGFEQLLRQLPAGTVVANLPNSNPTANALNRSIRRAVDERGLVLADMRGPGTTSWRGKLAADHFHPNDRGYSSIAVVFGDAIAGYLTGRRSESKMSPDTGPAARPTSWNHSAPKASR
jgi:lysophospholipase L1-like esterase